MLDKKSHMPAYIDILKREFRKRARKNERYSLRAYAKFLGLHVSALSRVLAGKLQLTPESGVRISKKLKLEVDESRRFVRSIVETRKKMEIEKVGKQLESPQLRPTPKKIASDLYAQIARLQALAILQLTFVEGFESDEEAIARKLNMKIEEVRKTVSLLLEIGMLQRDEEGRLINTDMHLTAVENSETTDARQRLQQEILERSLKSIETIPFGERLHYGMTMAIDPKKLDYARERFMNFMEVLSDELESEERTEVYQLGLSLFPLKFES